MQQHTEWALQSTECSLSALITSMSRIHCRYDTSVLWHYAWTMRHQVGESKQTTLQHSTTLYDSYNAFSMLWCRFYNHSSPCHDDSNVNRNNDWWFAQPCHGVSHKWLFLFGHGNGMAFHDGCMFNHVVQPCCWGGLPRPIRLHRLNPEQLWTCCQGWITY